MSKIGVVLLLALSLCVVSGLDNCKPLFLMQSQSYLHSLKPWDSSVKLTFGEAYETKMRKLLDEYVDYVSKNTPASYECEYEGHCNWVFTGSSGRALAFWKLSKYYSDKIGDETKAKQYLQLAKDYIDGSVQRLSDTFSDYVSFVNGNVGIYGIAAIIYDSLGNKLKASYFIGKIHDVLAEDPTQKRMDYDDGIPGLLYAVDYLETYFQNQHLFNRTNVLRYAQALFDHGYQNRYPNGTLQFPTYTRNTIGFGRGTTGALFRLMHIPELMANETVQKYIKLTVDYLIARQTSEGQVVDHEKGYENRIQWCHGAPSAIPVFAKAYQMFQEPRYLQAADLAADYTFKYGILQRGMNLCHGTSGNIYMIMYLYDITRNPKYQYYSYEMHKYAIDKPELTERSKMVSYDCLGTNSAFLDTSATLIGVYSDWLAQSSQIENMSMLAWGKMIYKSQTHPNTLSLTE